MPVAGRRVMISGFVIATSILVLSLVADGAAVSAESAPVPTVTVPEEPSGPGWRVTDLGHGRYEVSFTAATDFPVSSDRPTIVGGGLNFGPPVVEEDGRTVTAVVSAKGAPDIDVLDVWLSGDRIDEARFRAARSGPTSSLPTRPTEPLDTDDPGMAGPFTTSSSDYELPRIELPEMRRPVEMVGHVVEPAADEDTGPRPLVVFLHGQHETCYDSADNESPLKVQWPCRSPYRDVPNHLGYRYIQKLLASHGYATVSVRANGINAQDGRAADGGAEARAAVIRAHLDHWVGLSVEHQVDLDQVVLVGHSRGGEGANRAAIQIPLDAPYRIAGQVLLAPTNFAEHAAPYVPTAVMLPYCDGDVADLNGQRYTDVARDLAVDDTSLKTSVLVLGANHNYFNTEWTPQTASVPAADDWARNPDQHCGRRHPDRLSALEQRAVGKAYTAGAVRLFTGSDEYLPLFDGSPASVPSVGDAEVLSHAIGGGREVRRPGLEGTLTVPSAGADLRLCTGATTFDAASADLCSHGVNTWRVITPHWTPTTSPAPKRDFFEFSWDAPEAVGGLRFEEPLDLSVSRLEVRTLLDPKYSAPQLKVRISDSTGASALLDPTAGTMPRVLPLVPYFTKLWAQTLLVDAAATTGVNLADITTVEFVAKSATGRLWVADLAAAPSELLPAPAQRLPHVDIGTLRLKEGDSPGPQVAQVPFTITGEVMRAAQFVAWTAGGADSHSQKLIIDVTPGQTRGSIPFKYYSDTLDGRDQRGAVQLRPWRGIATDDYHGRVIIFDDDPTPKVAVRAPPTVREGRQINLAVTLEAPVSYSLNVTFSVIRGRGEQLRGTDVPRRWLVNSADFRYPRRPLWRLGASNGDVLPPGRVSRVLSIPTREDKVREHREFVTVRIRVGDHRVVRRIAVLNRM